MKLALRLRIVLAGGLALALPLAAAAAPTEIRGAAVLDHACGKAALKHMTLAHAGKFDEAVKLGTQEMQDQWKAMPAADRSMMGSMMKDFSTPPAEFTAAIKSTGVLTVDGKTASLVVKQEHEDKNGSSTQTFTQKYVIDDRGCWITH